eukprot:TRINITY_DN1453_c0_g1_i1.p8 TRINITY_DN1453_c0_g1~~TRINITY_DN1453_c0_g1_i1.p8  ORF type:complete len:103 (-),score=2.30 TRINITY_DN1453_c0_g1_i1:172-480(-)
MRNRTLISLNLCISVNEGFAAYRREFDQQLWSGRNSKNVADKLHAYLFESKYKLGVKEYIIERNNIGDSGAEKIASALRRNHTITLISLGTVELIISMSRTE